MASEEERPWARLRSRYEPLPGAFQAGGELLVTQLLAVLVDRRGVINH
jgi:hypothetical protein